MKLSRLNQEMRAFFADLYEGESKPLVLGEGQESARVALVGEGAGEQEALKGKPFVGKAGRNLMNFCGPRGWIARAVHYQCGQNPPDARERCGAHC